MSYGRKDCLGMQNIRGLHIEGLFQVVVACMEEKHLACCGSEKQTHHGSLWDKTEMQVVRRKLLVAQPAGYSRKG